MDIKILFWGIFAVIFIAVISIDMFASGKRTAIMKLKTALFWTALWVTVAFCFAAAIYFYYPEGESKGIEFLTGYIIEYSLSVDNLFVFIMIFSIMGISERHQPRILKWGIIGAIILRVLFILVGVGLLNAFSFMIYIFGAILVYTAAKMAFSKDEEIHPERNPLVKYARKIFNIDTSANNDHFFIKKDKINYATMAFLTLILVESTDVIFAVDSIPAVLAITHDPFIAITSNLFAILGLRALYFTIAGVLGLFRFLKYGISFILFFIGVKMLLSGYVHISVNLSLLVISITLASAILLSVVIKPSKK
jgi:tellurite resistance protein TerC